jgi:hypothetical protein
MFHCLEAQLADLSFGIRQVEQVCCDRPDMTEIINGEPALRRMLVFHFAGELKGRRTYWDYHEPVTGRPAEHSRSYRERPALVRVSNRSDSSAVDKCVMLVFELFNHQNEGAFRILQSAAIGRVISSEVYANECVRLEFEALKKTKAFFRAHPIANVNTSRDIHYHSFIEHYEDFSRYQRYLDQLDSNAYNPRTYYRQGYDRLTAEPQR